MALILNGSSQYINFGDVLDSVFAGEDKQFSISLWLNLTSATSLDKWLLGKYDRLNNKRSWFFYIGNTAKHFDYLVFAFAKGDASAIRYIRGSSAVNSTTTIYHLLLTYDGSIDTNNGLDRVQMYINGSKDTTSLFSPTGSLFDIPSTTGLLSIGAELKADGTVYSTAPKYLPAKIWDYRVYNRIVTANEISEIYYKRGADKVWQGLVGWWRLDELPSGESAESTDIAPHNMTSNSSPSPYVASANSEFEGKRAYYAFDGTGLVWGTSGTSGWLKLDYGSGNTPVLKGYAIQSYSDPNYQNVMPKNWTFKGSNDNSNWTTLDTRTNVTGWVASQWKEFYFNNENGYRYYMIDISANNGYSLCTYIREMNHYTSQFKVIDLSGNGNHGTPYYYPVYQDSPHRLRRGVLIS